MTNDAMTRGHRQSLFSDGCAVGDRPLVIHWSLVIGHWSFLLLALASAPQRVLAATAPSITTQPSSQVVIAGSSYTFSVSATGTPPLAFQWRFNGSNLAGQT